jgi:predicted DNA binding protein
VFIVVYRLSYLPFRTLINNIESIKKVKVVSKVFTNSTIYNIISTVRKNLRNTLKQKESFKMTTKQYFELFFEEKDLENRIYEIEYNGQTHFVETEFVIELIKKAQLQEQKAIREKLVYIDFRNGDVHHFLQFLAEAYIKNNY